MKTNIILSSIIFFISLNFTLTNAQRATKQGLDARTIETKVADILTEMPANNALQLNGLMKEMILLGPEGISHFTKSVNPPGEGDDSRVRYALGSLARYVTISGEHERRMCSEVFLNAIEQASDKEVKAFFITQLEFAGKDEVVSSLKTYLKDDRLCEPVTKVLLNIKTPVAEKALTKALNSVEGANNITVIKALGEFQSNSASKKILKYVNTENKDLRKVTLYALANIADEASEKVLANAAKEAGYKYEYTNAIQSYLLFARRMGEKGNIQVCERICSDIMKQCVHEEQENIRIAALGILVEIKGDMALKDLLNAMDDNNKAFRNAALRFSLSIPGNEATLAWIEKLNSVSDEAQAEIIQMLGERKDRLALEPVLQSLKSEKEVVRLAAIPAAGKLGKESALDPFFEIMKANSKTEVSAVQDVLYTMPAQPTLDKIIVQYSEMPSIAKIALLELIADRNAFQLSNIVFEETRCIDRSVRQAAFYALKDIVRSDDLLKLFEMLKNAESDPEAQAVQQAIIVTLKQIEQIDKASEIIIEQLNNTEEPVRSRIISILPEIGGQKVLQYVINEFETTEGDIKKNALLALKEWKDITAADELYQICKHADDDVHSNVAFAGYVKQVSNSPITAEKKLLLLRKIMPLSQTIENRKQLITELGKIRTFQSLMYTITYLNDPDLSQVACRSVMSIALPQDGNEVGMTGNLVRKILENTSNIITGEESDYDKTRIIEYLETMPDDAGFVRLFNGRDLSGWKGLVGNPVTRNKMHPDTLAAKQVEANKKMPENWSVRDGVLWFNGHGANLCTVKDYSDFELLVDWRITKNGDSGIYLRGTPQVQIWDTSRTDAGAQVGSGGLYNNQKHKRTPLMVADNQVEDWNTFRIIMVDNRVTVYLNGKLVVDNEVFENYWERDKVIYPAGPVELQAHGTNLGFRDIYIREIEREDVNQLSNEEVDDGFVSLFNGKVLSGWQGNTTDYIVEKSNIVLYPDKGGHGNLYTEKEYDDFILRFDFQLTPGANNGLGIRAPLNANAAYNGMELQILDNTAPIYKDLEDYQYHGSVYGVIPAKRGYLNPVGEWNSQEVIAKGPHIKVILNGKTIVDGNIDDASKNGTIDGKKHPGLKRKKGYIGFLGHGSVVRFRNIRIKDISK